MLFLLLYMTRESADSLKTTYTQRNLLYTERDAGVLLWSRFGRGPDQARKKSGGGRGQAVEDENKEEKNACSSFQKKKKKKQLIVCVAPLTDAKGKPYTHSCFPPIQILDPLLQIYIQKLFSSIENITRGQHNRVHPVVSTCTK